MKPFKDLVNQQLQILENGFINLQADLAKQTDQFRNIKEKDFENYFLPYFCGEKEMTDEIRSYWITIAGSPITPVRMVDSSDNFIMIIPALNSSNGISSMIHGKNNLKLHDIFTNYLRHNQITPVAGQNYIHRELSNLNLDLSEQQKMNLAKETEQWLKVFKHFGKDLNPNAKKETSKEIKFQNDDDGLSFD